ncbi:MAG: SDR family NAD(P)-dependent oxidoreductase [Gammaproteobacteria bacterium]|jgi:NAD(P)-dependent dehydrogenase (short-subunit alcohol dehydrogenase family)|nr:SDR family NAD(P)-dependent oxidoreductase [Gammaproteobacteria bacterium]
MTMNRQMLQGRVAIVTGAGKGLGRAWAVHLASLGASLVINNRATAGQPGGSSADSVVAEILAAGGSAVANRDSVESVDTGPRLVELALRDFGRLDIVIANAGIDRAMSFHKQSLADFEHVMEVNFFGAARLLHAAWPVLREANYGRVLVSTSTAGLYGNHGQAAYASSKAALQGLVKSLSIEGASRNIGVNSIAPYAATQLTRAAFPGEQAGRFSPGATAPLVAWLVSEQCALRGKTLVAGAGSARLVQTLEGETIVLGEDIPAAIEKLQARSCDHAPASASAEFEDFRGSL